MSKANPVPDRPGMSPLSRFVALPAALACHPSQPVPLRPVESLSRILSRANGGSTPLPSSSTIFETTALRVVKRDSSSSGRLSEHRIEGSKVGHEVRATQGRSRHGKLAQQQIHRQLHLDGQRRKWLPAPEIAIR